MKHCSATKKKEILPFATTWMDLEDSVLTGKPDTERRRPRDPTYTWGRRRSEAERGPVCQRVCHTLSVTTHVSSGPVSSTVTSVSKPGHGLGGSFGRILTTHTRTVATGGDRRAAELDGGGPVTASQEGTRCSANTHHLFFHLQLTKARANWNGLCWRCRVPG